MQLFRLLAIASMFLTACSPSDNEPAPQAKEPESETPAIVADTVYTNGKIYTVNESQPWAEAFAIKDGEFLAVGTADDVAGVTADTTKVIDLGGKVVLPGFIDLHHHLLTVADGTSHLALQNPDDADAMLAEIKAYADANPDLPFVRGELWNLGVFPNDSPRKELLDAIVPDRPVYILSQSGHSAWVNSKALEVAGVDKNTPQTSKIIFDTDPETGELSGTLREYGMAFVLQHLPKTASSSMVPRIKELSLEFSQGGFTSLQLAEGRPHHVQAARMAEEQGDLTVRLFPCWEWQSHYSAFTDEEMAEVMVNWPDYQSDMIDTRCVKIFADGGPDSFTSLLFDDYVGRPGFKGQTHRSQEALYEAVRQFNEDGLNVHIHALGDATGAQVIDVYADVRKANGNTDAVLHLAHAWMTRPEDIQRLAEIEGTTIDFSPGLNYRHPTTEFTFVPPIGEERYQKLFNVQSAIKTGIPVGFGSDYPSLLDPRFTNGFTQMQSWITRVDPFDQSKVPLNPEQAITLEQAIRGFTLDGAASLGFDWPDKVGSIEAGKLADFIVVDRDVFVFPVTDLHETLVVKTVVGGEVVYSRH
jgi:predicted amidohydrolase YtcJ